MESLLRTVIEQIRDGTSATSTSGDRPPYYDPLPRLDPDGRIARDRCPFNECDGSGWTYREREGGQPIAVRCRCLDYRDQAHRLQVLFGSARIPRRYLGQLLGDLDPARYPGAMETARAFVADWQRVRAEGRWLFLSGPVGTGKTALAYAILQELLAQGVVGLAETVPELMDHLRPGRDDQASERLEMCKTVDLLVLDDIGAQRTTEWVTERLFVILDARYREQRPTILTSNEHVESLERIPGWQRITDRIIEAATLVRMDGASYRLEAARRRREAQPA